MVGGGQRGYGASIRRVTRLLCQRVWLGIVMHLKKRQMVVRLVWAGIAWMGGKVIVPGNASESELYRRITLPKGHEEAMPNRGEPLSKAEAGKIRAWIDAGAKWPENFTGGKHWAYEVPKQAALPAVKQKGWPKNAVDHFVLAQLEQEGLKPSPEADKAALIRRVTLDLTGLPPKPEEVQAFLADTSSQAYEKLVDRLLASPQYGVRWARPWLDLARYADSHGFQRDDLRDLWPYRDWVINALNADMPFTQFTIEQLAGDLLPNATDAQRVATGFNRSAPTNVEAGSDPEETRVNQVLDRVNTLGAVWLGTTLECAQCHNHKYDPITMKDYYGLFAFFNNTALEADRTNPKVPGSIQFKGPFLTVEDAETKAAREKFTVEMSSMEEKIAEREKALSGKVAEMEKALAAKVGKVLQEHVLEIAHFETKEGSAGQVLSDKSVLINDEAPDKDTYFVTVNTMLKDMTGFKLETLTDPSLPGNGPGRGDDKRPNFVLNTFAVSAAKQNSSEAKPVKLAKAKADFAQKGFDPEKAIDEDAKSAWAINPQFGKPHWATFETTEPVGYEGGTKLTFTLVQEFGGGRLIGRMRLSALTGNPEAEAMPAEVVAALKVAEAKRTAKQKKAITEFCLAQDEELRKLRLKKLDLDRKLKAAKGSSTLVMQEVEQPRMSTVFGRGDFRSPGEKIAPGVPGVLHQIKLETKAKQPVTKNEAGPTRLDLAKWLVERENPLVARVTVNRWWMELFGHGLVATAEDFGIKGEVPTHPELLDWLAVEFMDKGWSMKQTLKTMVMSATYRQASRVSTELLALDDQNKLYARGPRFRMDAEMIRDNALAMAGLINLEQGGPPIKPYQPEGLWRKVGGQQYDYVVSPGEEKYRRGVYVVWKRGAPYPSFTTFDASGRMACTVKRSRSNTPLQALTLLNDPVYVEAAFGLAQRVLKEVPQGDVAARIEKAFTICLARAPKSEEAKVLAELYSKQ
ncbi:MAG: Planctomycete cytochrome, partial [Verrucomicrobia bacterium]|nr:Planctomycete cytochrome [Verrucomicrobiota bacterium]